MPESKFNPDSEDLTRKISAMEEVLKLTRDVLIQFMVLLPAPDKILLAQKAQLSFLKILDVITTDIATKATGDRVDQDEKKILIQLVMVNIQKMSTIRFLETIFLLVISLYSLTYFSKKLSRILQITQDQGIELSNPEGAD